MDDVVAGHRDSNEQGGWSAPFRRAFRRQLARHNYIGVGWPVEYGGGGKDMVYELILADELEYHDAPALDPSLNYIPYALMAYASSEQKARFLPALRRGELWMFLAYSEPDAGSDLANLRAQAVLENDEYVITGDKTYSSFAHFADYALLAARTDPSVPRHKGISLFLADMTLDGIQITQHRTMAGWDHPAVYFDHVRVPASAMLGGLNEGWRILMGAIDFERAALGAPGLADRQIDRLLSTLNAEAHPERRQAIAQRLVALTIDAEAARLYAYEVAARQAAGQQLQHETSVCVLLKREAVRLIEATGVELLGLDALLAPGDPDALFDGAVTKEYLDHTFYQFAAGGFDITRNVIATRGLGLPR